MSNFKDNSCLLFANISASYTHVLLYTLGHGLDIQSQTKVRVQKPKNPIWPPDGHFESDIAENG